MDNMVVVGNGVVGKSTAKLFGIKDYFDLQGNTIPMTEVAKRKYIFLCLPTPAKDNGYDLTTIEETLKQIAGYGCGGIIIIRSTVLPGTCMALAEEYDVPIVHNPEFLSQDTAEKDAKNPPFVVIGSDVPSHKEAVKALYESRFKYTEYIETDTVTAEMIKCAMNSYFATKVVFANTIYDLCQEIGANYELVKKAIYKHPYGASNHFDIFHKGGRGAGGKCLWKDLAAFSAFASEPFFTTIQTINKYLLEEYPKNEG